MAQLATFTDSWLKRNLRPAADLNLSLENWLEQTSYTETQKDRIRRDYFENPSELYKFFKTTCGSFRKDEFYCEGIKPLRGINARQNIYKAIFGPFVKELEKELYDSEHFIKHIPSSQRPRYIRRVMEGKTPVIVEGDDGLFRIGGRYYQTDFSSFEALFTQEFSEATEQRLFAHFLSRYPTFSSKLLGLVRRVCWETNTCAYSYKSGDRSRQLLFKVWLKRMSGEMWTSLGNGFANLMVILFAAEQAEAGVVIDIEWFRGLGLLCKLEIFDHLSDTTFCGLIFDQEDLQAIVDPRTTLLKFGWTNQKYSSASKRVKLKLLRSKALSLAYEVPCCPILAPFARRILELTKHISDNVAVTYAEDRWYKEQMIRELATGGPPFEEPTVSTRILFERRFGITVANQLLIESSFQMLGLEPVSQRVVTLLNFPDINYTLWDEYVTNTPADRDGFVPRARWTALAILNPWHTREARIVHQRKDRTDVSRNRYFPECT